MKKPYLSREQLWEIGNNCDWQTLWTAFGLIRDETRSKVHDWWCISPFNSQEKTPSFHMNEKGFKCFSTGKSGKELKFAREMLRLRIKQSIGYFETAQWLLENGLSHCDDIENPKKHLRPAFEAPQTQKNANREKKKKLENPPRKENLAPLLTQQGSHPEFIRRGISKDTCEYLRCGYLPPQTLRKGYPLNNRVVFQIGGVREDENGLERVILSHMGRAVNEADEAKFGKYWMYKNFRKSLELYNIDNLLLDTQALEQVHKYNQVVVVEGCFDVAKLVEAEILNVTATFGAELLEEQMAKIDLIARLTGVKRFKVWFDWDENWKGSIGQIGAVSLLRSQGYQASGFDWKQTFGVSQKVIPESIADPCDFSVKQLKWLRDQGVI